MLVRPSYVLGGRGMQIVYDEEQLATYMAEATEVSPDRPVLVDRFLDDAIEIDVDAIFDGDELYLGGVMEHIEEAGIHSGDSACVLPPVTLGREEVDRVRACTEALARGLGVQGLLNVQFALAADVLYVLEANPRASRTAPFVSKATGVPLAKVAARVMLGATIAELRAEGLLPATGDGGRQGRLAPVAVKEAVLPFKRFRTVEGRGVDHILGPEMRSTGEVMGIDSSFGTAFAKSQLAAYGGLPTKGTVFVSVANRDKRAMIFPVKRLADLGFEIMATDGTAEVLHRNGIEATLVRKHSEGRARRGSRPSSTASWPATSTWSSTRRRVATLASTATRSAPPRSPWTGRSSPRCRSLPRPCTASRRSGRVPSVCGRCRSGPPQPGRTGSSRRAPSRPRWRPRRD